MLEGIVELHDLAAGDQAVRLNLGEHGEAGGGAHAGQADVQLALGEDLRVDAAGIERQALRLVDGDGVGELERDLGIGTHDGGLDPVDGPAIIVHLDDGLGLVDLPSVPLDADLLVRPVELDRHGVRGRVGDGALRAVDVTLLRAVHERHHAGAAAQDDPLRRHLVAAVDHTRDRRGELDFRGVERVDVLAVDRIGDAVVGAQHQRVLRQVGAGALRVRVEVIEARRVADAGAVQVVDEIGVGLAHDRLEDVRLEIEAGPVPRLEAPALEVSGIELHQQRGVAFGHDRRQLEEIADEDHLLRAVARHGLGDHPHHVVEQVDAAHRDLVDDDYLRGVEHLAGPLGAIGGADPRRDFQRAVDRRAVREVQRGDAGGRQGEEIDVARLQVRYEGVEHVALTRAGVAREKHVPPVPQRAQRLGLFRCKAVTVCHFHIPSSVRPVTGN